MASLHLSRLSLLPSSKPVSPISAIQPPQSLISRAKITCSILNVSRAPASVCYKKIPMASLHLRRVSVLPPKPVSPAIRPPESLISRAKKTRLILTASKAPTSMCCEKIPISDRALSAAPYFVSFTRWTTPFLRFLLITYVPFSWMYLDFLHSVMDFLYSVMAVNSLIPSVNRVDFLLLLYLMYTESKFSKYVKSNTLRSFLVNVILSTVAFFVEKIFESSKYMTIAYSVTYLIGFSWFIYAFVFCALGKEPTLPFYNWEV